MPAPVKHTCPKIDKAIDAVNDASKTASFARYQSDTRSTEEECFHDIEHALSPVVGILNGLRSDNDALRTWGKDKEEELDQKEKEIQEKDREISRLESELEDAKALIESLEKGLRSAMEIP